MHEKTTQTSGKRAVSPEQPARISDDAEEPSSKRDGGQSQGGVLGLIDFGAPPFSGEIFEVAQLKKALWMARNDKVRIVTANVQGRFAGIFGQVDNESQAKPDEVSLVVNLDQNDQWKIDGCDQKEAVAALLMAAMIDKGVADKDSDFGIGSIGARVMLFSTDVRAGILHWDDTQAREVLENMHLAKLDGIDPKVEERLREMGLVRLSEIYPWDELDPSARDCFAYRSDRKAIQEMFWADFVSNRLGELEELGCDVCITDQFGVHVVDSSDWYGEINEPERGTNWFEFECGIQVGRQRVNILPCLVKYLESKPATFTLKSFETLPPEKKIPVQLEDDGKFVAVPAERLHTVLSLLVELFDKHPISEDGTLKLHKVRAAQLTRYEGDEQIVNEAPQGLREHAEELEKLKPKADPEAPEEFLATLRPYQQDGFEWLQFLREQGLGGILADDMGLGKTIQTLCHLFTEKKEGRANLPSLILAPKSVVYNWEKEVKKFAPSMSILVLMGPQRKKYFPVMGYSDLVITSYPLLLRDAEELLNQPFHFVVLDEAHTIKNSTSAVTKVAYRIDARHRLALSGTPIENNLGELWSQFHFLMPGFLGTEDSFTRCFRNPIEKHRDESLRKRLAERVAPLMLRRVKTLVAKDLPPKTEIVKKVELSKRQVEIYEAVRAGASKEVREEIERRGVEATKLVVLEALMKLRQVCCHPKLIRSMPSAQKARRSAKMDLLMDWLPTMVAEGRKILIFSQFTRMISLIEKELDKEKLKYITLTGGSKDRGALCDQFQSGKVPIFLISLRAGGTGLNLTEADTVIHYDPWWNPALEAQATDRAYRIGQKNPVFVYKLISEGTIEEKILMLQQKKRALFEGILEGTPQKLSFSDEELDDLLAPMGK